MSDDTTERMLTAAEVIARGTQIVEQLRENRERLQRLLDSARPLNDVGDFDEQQ